MFDPRITTLLLRASRLSGRPGPAATDALLLDRLARDRDAAAFGELLTRHGPGVWALCRRLVRSEHDAEDVFQATFLVLARDAARVRNAASVGSWLFGVASRIGRKVCAQAQRVPDQSRLPSPAVPPDPARELSWNEVRSALDEELARLPELLRAPILFCYFDGLTQDEAAVELGWNPRTVKHRVARARELLRTRLTRRGIELPAVLAAPLLSAGIAAAAPARLLEGLSLAAVNFAQRQPPGPEVSPAAVALTHSEGSMSFLRFAVLVACTAGLIAVGSLIARPPDTSPLAATVSAAEPPAAEPDTALPAGAVRIGGTHFRQTGWHSRVFLTDGGKTLITAGEGVLARFWNVETGKKLHEIILDGGYQDAAFSHAANLLAVVGVNLPDGDRNKAETALWLIDTATRKIVHIIPMPGNHGSNSQKVCISADGKRVVVEYEGDIRVIDAKSGDELLRHKGRINAGTLALSPDGKTIAFGRYDVYLWRWDSGEEPKKFAALGGFGTESVLFGPDGKMLFVASGDRRVLTFEIATGQQTSSLDLGSPWKWAFSPDGKTLAVVGYFSTKGQKAVVLWDPATGKEKARFPVGRDNASHVSWSADGTLLAAATDSRLWVWDVKTGKPLGPSAPGHEGQIGAFAFTPDGRLFTASDDHTVRSWDAVGKSGLELVHDSYVRDVAVSPDGALVAGSALGNDLRVWDAKTGAERFKLLGNGEMGGKRKVRFTPDGKRLVAWGDDLYLRVWEVRNGKLLAEHRTLPDGMTEADLDDDRRQMMILGLGAADISADGSTLAFCPHKLAQVFDVATGKETARFEADPNGVATLALSPDGKRMAIGGRGKSIETRLPDGKTRHSAAQEHQTAVWDLSTKKVIWQAASPGSWSGELGFSPDGTRLAESVSTEDKKYALRFWDAAAGKDLGRIDLPQRGGHFAFDRTGKRLAVTQPDTTAVVYELDKALKPSGPK